MPCPPRRLCIRGGSHRSAEESNALPPACQVASGRVKGEKMNRGVAWTAGDRAVTIENQRILSGPAEVIVPDPGVRGGRPA